MVFMELNVDRIKRIKILQSAHVLVYLGGGFKHVFMFHSWGNDSILWLRFFFEWVGKKTHQLDIDEISSR